MPPPQCCCVKPSQCHPIIHAYRTCRHSMGRWLTPVHSHDCRHSVGRWLTPVHSHDCRHSMGRWLTPVHSHNCRHSMGRWVTPVHSHNCRHSVVRWLTPVHSHNTNNKLQRNINAGWNQEVPLEGCFCEQCGCSMCHIYLTVTKRSLTPGHRLHC